MNLYKKERPVDEPYEIVRSLSSLLSPAKTQGQQLIPGVPHESYHSLLFWSALLCAERDRQSRPLPAMTQMYLALHTRTLYQNWMVEMRYHPNRAEEADAVEVAEAATWLFNNRVELGR